MSREQYERAAADADLWRTLYCKTQERPLAECEHVPDTVPVVRPEPVKDAITQKIEDVSEGDAKVARHFRSMVRRMKKEGVRDGDILAAIRWTSTEDTRAE